MRISRRLLIAVTALAALPARADARAAQVGAPTASAIAADLRAALQTRLDQLREAAGVPGATLGVVLRDGTQLALASGVADREKGTAMRPTDKMLMGSVGKTYVSAVALALVAEKKLELDALVSKYLGDRPWFARLPNAKTMTVRMLMNHTSGLTRYELREDFIADLRKDPDRVWKPEEQIAYLLDEQPPFAAGAGWDYSDTNYIVLGLILEKASGARLEDEIRRRLLEPLHLSATVPSTSRTIPGLVQGYAGKSDPFGVPDTTLVDGRFVFNPQWEWAGGGYASTAIDLARWAAALYGGDVIPPALAAQFLDGVAAPMLGRGARYGLGVILRETKLGELRGHSGFFPGYMTEMGWFPDHGFAIALMIDTSDFASLKQRPGAMLQELAAVVAAQAK